MVICYLDGSYPATALTVFCWPDATSRAVTNSQSFQMWSEGRVVRLHLLRASASRQ